MAMMGNGPCGILLFIAFLWAFAVDAQPAPPLEANLVVAATGGGFGGSLQKFFYQPFEAKTGVKVTRVDAELPEQWAKLRVQVDSDSVEFDIVTATPADLIEKRNLLQPIDCAKLANLATEGVAGACDGWGLFRTLGGMVVAYSTKQFPDRKPASWNDLWDAKTFPGPRALPATNDCDWWVPVAALLADGALPSQLFPLDLDRAYRKLDQIKPNVALWYKSNDQYQQAMRSGEAVLALASAGRTAVVKNEGFPVDFTWNQSIRDVGFWAMAKDAPHPHAAMAFLNFFVANPEQHFAFSNVIGYDTANRNAINLLPESDRPKRVTYPANLASQIIPDYEWIAKNRSMLRERWNSWIVR
jgi:mannopine transport system substrate-binding protein